MSTDSPQRIVLAEDAPLLNAMLRHILHRAENVEIVEELHDIERLPTALEEVQPDWVVMSLSFDGDLPGWVDGYIAGHPYVGILVLAADSDHIRLKWAELHEQELDGASLSQMIHILRGRPSWRPD